MDHYEEEEEEQAEPQVVEVIATDVGFVDLRDDQERQAYALLKDRVFAHTKDFDSDFLKSTSMNVDFANIWHAIGWDTFCAYFREGISFPHHPIPMHLAIQ